MAPPPASPWQTGVTIVAIPAVYLLLGIMTVQLGAPLLVGIVFGVWGSSGILAGVAYTRRR